MYDEIRDETALSSQHTILAIHRAAENVNTCVSRREDGKAASKPTYTSPTVSYDTRTMTLFPETEQVSLTTTGSRVRCDLVLPEEDDGYQYEYLDDEEWELSESTLHRRDDEWYLHIGFRRRATDEAGVADTTENGTVLGVDLGVNQIAVTSTARFFDAARLNHERREYERVREGLQTCGTRSAHRTLLSVAGREKRFAEDVLHTVAKEIVREAGRYDCDGIVFEALDGIRERLPQADWHSRWAFDRLLSYVTYKARAVGIFVETVVPRNTSRRCAECGAVDDANRPSQNVFDCQQCDNRNHADYNAAKNVASAYLRREQQPSCRRGVSQYALKSGTVTPTVGFVPYPDGFEAETTDKLRLE